MEFYVSYNIFKLYLVCDFALLCFSKISYLFQETYKTKNVVLLVSAIMYEKYFPFSVFNLLFGTRKCVFDCLILNIDNNIFFCYFIGHFYYFFILLT